MTRSYSRGHPKLNAHNFDEMDFCIRARIAGLKIYAFNDLRIRHYGGATTLRFEADQSAYLFVRHALRSIRRNYRGIKKFLAGGMFISAASIRTLMNFRTYVGKFVVLRAVMWQINDVLVNSLYIEEAGGLIG